MHRAYKYISISVAGYRESVTDPAIVVFMQKADQLPSSKTKLIVHRGFKVKLDTMDIAWGLSWREASRERCGV